MRHLGLLVGIAPLRYPIQLLQRASPFPEPSVAARLTVDNPSPHLRSCNPFSNTIPGPKYAWKSFGFKLRSAEDEATSPPEDGRESTLQEKSEFYYLRSIPVDPMTNSKECGGGDKVGPPSRPRLPGFAKSGKVTEG